MGSASPRKFNVGGVLMDRPFKIRRLGHFGLNVTNMEAGLRFYRDLLGFRVSDTVDFGKRIQDRDLAATLGDPNGYFMRYGTDHHAFVLFNRRVREAMGRDDAKPGLTINQITWQVGSLKEVNDAIRWFEEEGVRLQRSGRDMPGSNWHTYLCDPDDHSNELYYGMEQVGWDGYSKPQAMYDRAFHNPPDLPQLSELEEVEEALKRGVRLDSGRRDVERLPADYDVDGIRLPRPFKIVRIGPLGLFVRDMSKAEDFYCTRLGFVVSEEVEWKGHRCVLLRAGSEHHSVGLYPIELQKNLGLRPDSSLAYAGFQVANYQQLKDAARFLEGNGATIMDSMPAELCPGMDYTAHVMDPDGHCIQLYYYMEQLGGNEQRRYGKMPTVGRVESWPETVPAVADTYQGETFMGPWG